MTKTPLLLSLLILIILLMSGCTSATVSPVPTTAAPQIENAQPALPAITLEQLKNLEYINELASSGKARLVDGIFTEPAAPNSEMQVDIRLADWFKQGDLDGDGNPDVAVLLFSNAGGSGTFVDLAAVLQSQDGPRHAASAPLGDRVKIQSIEINNGIITVQMITQGPDDPMCCPTMEVTRRYQLQPGGLVLLP